MPTIPASIRDRVFDCILPAYVLTDTYDFLAFNAAFRCLIAQEVGIEVGAPVSRMIDALENGPAIWNRAAVQFAPGRVPEADHEYLRFSSARYGVVEMQKFAARIPVSAEGAALWLIQLNIISSPKLQQLFDDLIASVIRARDDAP
jgi:hypothetical protein